MKPRRLGALLATTTITILAFPLTAQAAPRTNTFQSTCQAQGGTYSFSKGVQKCVTTTTTYPDVDDQGHPISETYMTYDPTDETVSDTLFGVQSGKYQEYTVYIRQLTTTTTCTQKGTGGKTQCTSSTVNSDVIIPEECEFVYDTPQLTTDQGEPIYQYLEFRPQQECADRGLIPTSIP